MENTQQVNPKSNGEVDLSQLFRMIGRGLNKMGSDFIYGIASLRNMFFTNLKFFIAIMIIGVLLGLLYSFLIKQKYYRSSMVLTCEFFNNQIMSNSIGKLNDLCAEPKRLGLQAELGISDTLAKRILGFDFEPFVSEQEIIELEVLKEQLSSVAEDKKELVEKIINRISIENKDAFRIGIRVTDPTAAKAIEQPLVNYFQNNEFVRRRLEVNKRVRMERRNKLVQESNALDSLKKVIYAHLSSLSKAEKGSNNVILNDDQQNNPLDIFREDLALHKEILQLESDLFLRPDFEVIDNFTAFNRPESFSIYKILAISLLGSILLGYLILFAWRFDRLLAKYPFKN